VLVVQVLESTWSTDDMKECLKASELDFSNSFVAFVAYRMSTPVGYCRSRRRAAACFFDKNLIEVVILNVQTFSLCRSNCEYAGIQPEPSNRYKHIVSADVWSAEQVKLNPKLPTSRLPALENNQIIAAVESDLLLYKYASEKRDILLLVVPYYSVLTIC